MAIRDSFLKLTPRHQIRNPVMFTVYIGPLLTTALFIQALLAKVKPPPDLFCYYLWLWFTLLFANFAEAMAEGAVKHKHKLYVKHDVKFKQKNCQTHRECKNDL